MSNVRGSRNSPLGFTLIEVVISTALTLLLFFGAMSLYIAAAKFSVNTNAACYAATDAANAVQHTVGDAQEACWIALPGEAGWTPPTGLMTAAFQTPDGGTVLSTGVELVFPATAAVSVQNQAGGTLLVMPAPYDRTLAPPAASQLWIYRADSGGTPNAASGSCVWLMGTEQGQSINKALTHTLDSSAANAVQFSRPVTAANTPQALPYQLEIKLVSAYYSPLQQAQTSELRTSLQEAPIVGKCVLLRDHELNLDHEPNPTSPYGDASAINWNSD